jgi:hypothetical protein
MDEKILLRVGWSSALTFRKRKARFSHLKTGQKIATLEDFDWSSILSRKEKNGNGQRLNRKSGAGE